MKLACSIVIPIYNEEDAVVKTVQDIHDIMHENNLSFEIILVDDGSTDGSADKIHNYIENKYDNAVVVYHDRNLGYGAALKSGFKISKYEHIVITDADATYPNDEIPKLLNYINDYDMVVGARIGKNVKIPLIRKPAKWFINKLANYLTNYKIPDLNSGLRVMKKSLIEKFLNYLPNGFSLTSTITLSLLTNSYTIKYVPIDYMTRKGKSKIKPIQDTLNFIQLIIRTVMYFNPLKIFLPFSLIFIVPGLVFLIRDFISLNIAQTSVLLIITGSIILAIGMLSDLINKRL
jgi:glycosyltransferase involved in cell wall biosynthesis